MRKDGRKRVWLYGRHQIDIQFLLEYQMVLEHTVLGYSVLKTDSTFPLAGLTQAMQAAIRGELDELVLSDDGLLGSDATAESLTNIFTGYGVTVKSASSDGRSNS